MYFPFYNSSEDSWIVSSITGSRDHSVRCCAFTTTSSLIVDAAYVPQNGEFNPASGGEGDSEDRLSGGLLGCDDVGEVVKVIGKSLARDSNSSTSPSSSMIPRPKRLGVRRRVGVVNEVVMGLWWVWEGEEGESTLSSSTLGLCSGAGACVSTWARAGGWLMPRRTW